MTCSVLLLSAAPAGEMQVASANRSYPPQTFWLALCLRHWTPQYLSRTTCLLVDSKKNSHLLMLFGGGERRDRPWGCLCGC